MTIKTALLNGVLQIEIARPERKNALTLDMYTAMADALVAAQTDAQVCAVIITGQPGIFTSGNDLEDFLQRPPQDESGWSVSPLGRFMLALRDCDKPVIAAVTGGAVGIGATMLLHCDFVYMSDEARLSMPFVSLALVPEYGASLLLAQRMGQVKASEKLLLGAAITPDEALEWGLVNQVLPPTEVLPQARRTAERFQTLPQEAVCASKRLMRAGQGALVEQAMQREVQVFAQRLSSPETKEAIAAFFQKRSPDFAQFRAPKA
ncbi:enoyl-CoA hydratase [Amphibiibacter pelophylacis]|uniref:Enoyl-CoA hydratase n=1 Tax=Amphibiibacter pelophylacis TaxID=1799477 RepID=A0ACC6P1M7_9BURK